MKKSINYFSRLAATLILTSTIVFSGCSNLIESKNVSSEENGNARIILSVGVKEPGASDADSRNAARTFMPFAEKQKGAETLTDIKLYSKLSSSSLNLGSSDTLLASWENYKELQLTPYSQNLASGTYDFMLTAKNYGATMSQTLTGKILSSGSSTTLNFTALSPDPNGAQTGAVELELHYDYTYAADEYKKFLKTYQPYPIISLSLDSNVIATKESSQYKIVSKASSAYEILPDENGHTYEISYSSGHFISAPIAAGFHIVTFTFVAEDNSVFVYPIPVYIETGYLSTNYILEPFRYTNVTAEQSSGVIKYTVTYNSNLTGAVTKTQDFYPGSSLADAEALGFAATGNKRFKEWNTKADGSGVSYKAGTSPELTGNLTLYAQWAEFKKVTYVININDSRSYPYNPRTDTYVQQYEEGSALVDENKAFPAFVSASNYSNYTFCGWDTKEDGSEKRYSAGAKPALTEDTVLYAMWCGKKNNDIYEIWDSKEWNALMGAPFANKNEGIIEVNAEIRNTADYSIAASLTNRKTFKGDLKGGNITNNLSGVLFDTIGEGSVVRGFIMKGALCNINKGKISDITISGMNMTGLAAIAKKMILQVRFLSAEFQTVLSRVMQIQSLLVQSVTKITAR